MALPPAIAALEQRVATQPEEKRQALQLDRLTRAYITEYGVPLIAIYRVRPEAARSPDATREGLFRINAIRGQLERLLASENRLAAEREVSATHDATRAIRVGVGANLVHSTLQVSALNGGPGETHLVDRGELFWRNRIVNIRKIGDRHGAQNVKG